MCSGDGKTESYLNCPVHRLVKDGWLQCGDVVDGSGANSKSALGVDRFEDECFSVDMGAAFGGIVGYANSGPHNNGSQFVITLGPCAWMNKQVEGFGRVVQGFDTLQRINRAPTKNERPTPGIIIGTCGRQG